MTTTTNTTKPNRPHVLGGTDAATLLGLGRISPVVLYLRLRGEVADTFDGNDATEAGTLFEDGVAVPLALRRHGLALRRPHPRTLAHPQEPRIGVSLDFVADDGIPVDAKFTGSRAKWGGLDRVPLPVAAQMQWGMAVMRAAGRPVPEFRVFACFAGEGFATEVFPVAEDRAVGDRLLELGAAMLARVDAGMPPEAGSEADARALFLGRRGEVLSAPPDVVAQIGQLRALEEQASAIEEQVAALRDSILPAIGQNTEVVDPATGELLATWRPNRVFDAVAFAARHPHVVDQCQKRVFDRKAAEKLLGKAEVEKFMRDPIHGEQSTRPFKLSTSKGAS